MCGIAGILRLNPKADPVPTDWLARMQTALTHRGPDESGTYVDSLGRCGLTFRRLSIIDLAGGHQPLANEDDSVWTVFNGEIYNFRQLREALAAAGHRFRTQVDSEVIVHLYEAHREQLFTHLQGMFAIAVWDETAGRLVLARDRFGQKPLVYAIHDDYLFFASETKAILAATSVPRILDPAALHQYLTFQYVPAPDHIYEHFHKLPPASLAIFEPDRRATEPAITSYYQVPQPGGYTGTYQDAVVELGERLTTAVERRLIADVPLGAFLSGGIDSSAVVAIMAELGARPLRTFSIGFPDPRYDETAHARAVAEHFATEHHEHQVNPDAARIVGRLAQAYDEPFADSSAIPTFWLSEYTRQSVKVALTGDGGDEAFAGYDRYRAAQLAARFDQVPQSIRRWLSRQAGLLPRGQSKSFSRRLYRFLHALGRPPAERYLAWISIFDRDALWQGYHFPMIERLVFQRPADRMRTWYEQTRAAPADRAIHVDYRSYLPGDLLVKVDIASMSCGLECRSPFLDHELVDFARSLPLDWRLGRGAHGGKQILKAWAADRLPAAIQRREKMGFGVPIGEWFRNELADSLRERILSTNAISRLLFRDQWLQSLLEDHITGRENHAAQLWSLMMLEAWAQQWQPDLSRLISVTENSDNIGV